VMLQYSSEDKEFSAPQSAREVLSMIRGFGPIGSLTCVR
jgi:hypothetical protein